jgi:hypothetical protein
MHRHLNINQIKACNFCMIFFNNKFIAADLLLSGLFSLEFKFLHFLYSLLIRPPSAVN